MSWSIIADAGNQVLRKQFDFLIATHAADAKPAEKPFQIMEKYVDAVGHARKLPWPGYWHSKNRYASQEELLEAARGFHNRSVPVDVIVIDWFHWKIMGDWSFNAEAWCVRACAHNLSHTVEPTPIFVLFCIFPVFLSPRSTFRRYIP